VIVFIIQTALFFAMLAARELAGFQARVRFLPDDVLFISLLFNASEKSERMEENP
jgi:hypothetical protein